MGLFATGIWLSVERNTYNSMASEGDLTVIEVQECEKLHGSAYFQETLPLTTLHLELEVYSM